MCLLATKVDQKRINKDVKQLVVSPREEHSKKPLLHKEIERLVKVLTLNYLQEKTI